MDMVHWILLSICILAGAATGIGAICLWKGKKSRVTFALMSATFIAECAFLYMRGEERGKCPLGDWGEILLFIAWSLNLFYLLIGSTYRVSLLGFFSTPFVMILSAVALVPGVLEPDVVRMDSELIDPWGELHAALAVLSYGALALAMVAAVMFLALDKKLKGKDLRGGLFQSLPPVFELTTLSRRLLWLGLTILSGGIFSSFLMEDFASHASHLWAAIGVWLAYCIFLLWAHFKGMTPRAFAQLCCLLFFGSLIPFALL